MNWMCGKCAFWENIGDGTGECRRYAPKPAYSQEDPDDYYHPIWPKTKYDDWCGEWREQTR